MAKNKKNGNTVEVIEQAPEGMMIRPGDGAGIATETVKPARDWNTEWDFPVIGEKLKTSRGIETPVFAVVNAETGDYVGSYKGEKIISNKSVVESIANALTEKKIDFKFHGRTTDGGARFFGEFELTHEAFVTPDKDRVIAKITVENSYNGTLARSMSMGFLKMICLNQAICISKVFESKQRHVLDGEAKLQIETANIQAAIEAEGMVYTKMSKMQLSPIQGRTVLANIVRNSKIAISEKTAQKLELNWLSPTEDEQKQGDTLFRLFNAGTRLLRNTAETKFELNRRLQTSFVGQIGLAVDRPAIWQSLLTPVPASN